MSYDEQRISDLIDGGLLAEKENWRPFFRFKDAIAIEKGFSSWSDLLKHQINDLITRDLEEAAQRYAYYNRLCPLQRSLYHYLMDEKTAIKTGEIAKYFNLKSQNISNQLKNIESKGAIVSERIGKNLQWQIVKWNSNPVLNF